MAHAAASDPLYMRRALRLAERGRGAVEPNPMVGCVLVREDRVVGAGWHARFGGDHAEVAALRDAGEAARDATAYVTLEPCCHHGKTPPCSDALIQAGVRRVVVAQQDPFPQVDGGGLRRLKQAGIEVQVGMLEADAMALNAAYLKLVGSGRPWVLAKWAMTLDGKLAARTGDSQWISSPASRSVVHQIRGYVDGILVGRGTVICDDPRLTARPTEGTESPRIATRVVLDSRATLPLESRLVQTVEQAPVLVVVGPEAKPEACRTLEQAGCEVLQLKPPGYQERAAALLNELGRRRWTRLLVEGGAGVFGTFFDARLVDEVHAFIAPKLVGGADAPSPLAGGGLAAMADASVLLRPTVERSGDDVYIHGRLNLPAHAKQST